MQWAGHTWGLLPERALWWPARGTLVVADLHLGKAATFRAAGVPVPEGGAAADLASIETLTGRLGARRLVVVGDLFHARTGKSPAVLGALADWRRRNPDLDVLLVRGNHDVGAGDPPVQLGFRVADGPASDAHDGPVRFAHDPEDCAPGSDSTGPTICGHLHPAVVLHGPRSSFKASCFWFAPRVAVIPAFGSFTGTCVVRPAPGDRVFVVGDGEVVEAPLSPVRSGPARRGRVRG